MTDIRIPDGLARNGLFERRRFLQLAATATVGALTIAAPASAQSPAVKPAIGDDDVKAILFDVQGTIVDFYSTIVRKGDAFTKDKGIEADWTRITNQWRAEYRKQLDKVISGEFSWRSTDRIYRDALDILLQSYDWGSKLGADDRDRLNGLWAELEPWPDTRPGLERLGKKYTVSTLSNGSMASVVSIVKIGRLPFDCVLTAELVKSSKPDPKVYALATSSLNLPPEQILMVACHKYDLAAAKKLGFKVAFIPRPLEFGPNGKVDLAAEDYFDLMPSSVEDLAATLGV